MTKKNKYLIIFILLDISQFIFWIFSLGPFTSWKSGPIDAQSGFFFICLIGIYFSIFLSLFFFVFFLFQYIRSLKYILVGILLNVHVFIIIYKYLNSVL
jgi:hypothetical protein